MDSAPKSETKVIITNKLINKDNLRNSHTVWSSKVQSEE